MTVTNDLGTFTISGEWMTACGYGSEPVTVPVVRVMDFPHAGNGFNRMFKVEMPSGYMWIVAETRGVYHEPVTNDLYEDARFPVAMWEASGSRLGYLEWLDTLRDLERPGGCGAARRKPATVEAEVDPFGIFADEPIACEDADKPKDMRGRLTSASDAEAFMLAGKATITLVSVKTQARFTYRISASDDRTCHFVALLSGADNENDYSYLGRIARSMFWRGRKIPRPGDVGVDAPSMNAFAWAWQRIVSGTLPDSLEVWHEGRCGRCARKLTVPSSVKQGFGPECQGKLGE
jgi:hypothetical protein